jgi:hypothetical protein
MFGVHPQAEPDALTLLVRVSLGGLFWAFANASIVFFHIIRKSRKPLKRVKGRKKARTQSCAHGSGFLVLEESQRSTLKPIYLIELYIKGLSCDDYRMKPIWLKSLQSVRFGRWHLE